MSECLCEDDKVKMKYIRDKVFSQNDQLKTHLRTHPGHKSDQYSLYEKVFSHNMHRKPHMNIHASKNRSFGRSVCY